MRWLQKRYLLSASVLVLALVVSFGLDHWLGSTMAVLLILQLSIVVIALHCHSRLAYVAAIAEAVSFNFLFTTPRYSLQMFHLDDIINLVVFIVVAFTTSQLAERYRRQQNALKQVQLRHQILLSVSHDLRTPLAGIIGNLTTFKEYQMQLQAKEKDELLDSAIKESHRLHQYIENLLQATKLQHGVVRIQKQQESIVHIVKSVIGRFSSSTTRIEVVVNGAVPSVEVSRALLEQALFNVLDNALRYSPKDKQVSVTIYQSQQNVVIDVYNQGQSLQPEDAQRMFELFYSGKEKRSDDSGSGLGLSVAQGVISAHHGHIECVDVSQGCLIRITLPSSQQGEQ
ncbi:sensor histidine kinase [Vibrio gazogenes]|uniref:histidine kinase n=1 Tax=Vibrio gazogenes TaxID=687 RepID=A0A1Z2SH92_VIBGA|nr:ATP-binding protein [Vibrio gazogenes]ASA56553.1 histidine kinase [Vibrio gazogenes]